MSKKISSGVSENETVNQNIAPTGIPTPGMNIEPAKLEALNKEMTELISTCVKLAIKVARCDCNNKEKCPVYIAGKRIAEVVDTIQELSEGI